MVSPWFFVKTGSNPMFPNSLLIHFRPMKEQYQAILRLKNVQRHRKVSLQNQPKIGKKPDGYPLVFGDNWTKTNVLK